MPRKIRKPKPPSAAKLARLRSRAHIGAVPPGRAVADRRFRPPKHKRPPQAEEA